MLTVPVLVSSRKGEMRQIKFRIYASLTYLPVTREAQSVQEGAVVMYK